MIEVFKTDIESQDDADRLIDQLQKVFLAYKVNFDLEDCDRILRVECTTGIIDTLMIVKILNDCGFHAEVLPDDPHPRRPGKPISMLFTR